MKTLEHDSKPGAAPSRPQRRLRNFASDNGSGVCPEVWEAMRAADAAGLDGHLSSPA